MAAGLKANIRRAVRTGLRGVWVAGPFPDGGALLAPTHHSWWDGYVLAVAGWSVGQAVTVMMTDAQLARFPFLRRAGAIGAREVRGALRALRAGHWVVVFPEGELRPTGGPGPLQPGAAWLAERAGAPLVPVAARVILRGAQQPEAYVRFGHASTGADLPGALAALVGRVDADLRAAPPESPPGGYLRLAGGARSQHERLSGPGRLLARLLRERS